jgi:hypothetical protein
VGRDQLARDGEPEPAARRVRRAMEPVEDPLGVPGSEAGPGVRDRERHRRRIRRRGLHEDVAFGRRVAERVRDEVAKDFPEPVRVGEEGRQALRVERPESDAGRFGGSGHRGNRVVDERGRLDFGEIEPQRAGLGEGDGPQVVDQPVQQQRLVAEGGEVRVVARAEPVEHPLQTAADDRERRPQLVADVGEQRPAALFGSGQPFRERVERPGGLTQLPRTPFGDANVVVALGEPIGGLQQVVDRDRNAPRATAQQDQEERADQQREQHLAGYGG